MSCAKAFILGLGGGMLIGGILTVVVLLFDAIVGNRFSLSDFNSSSEGE